jgi:hypothetical protein
VVSQRRARVVQARPLDNMPTDREQGVWNNILMKQPLTNLHTTSKNTVSVHTYVESGAMSKHLASVSNERTRIMLKMVYQHMSKFPTAAQRARYLQLLLQDLQSIQLDPDRKQSDMDVLDDLGLYICNDVYRFPKHAVADYDAFIQYDDIAFDPRTWLTCLLRRARAWPRYAPAVQHATQVMQRVHTSR